MTLDESKKNWEKWAEIDPLYAILSQSNKQGGKWNKKEFFDSGATAVDVILNKIDSLGLLSRRERALDFGCGVGRLTRPLGSRFGEVIGLDISSKMIELAKGFSPPPNCRFVVNDKSDLSLFPDGHFDFVLSLITLQHVNTRISKNYLKEFVRVLSNHGVAYFGIPETLKQSSKLKARAGTWLGDHDRTNSLYRSLNRRRGPWTEMHGMKKADVVSLIESAGGSVRAIEETQDGGRNWSSYRYLASKV